MLPQCSHITKKRGIYYYRRRLPLGLRGEVVLSLRTRSYRHAEWSALKLSRVFSRVVAVVQKKVGETDIARIVREYLRRHLEGDMWLRAQASNSPVYASVLDDEDPVAADLAWVDAELRTARSELAGRFFDHQATLIDDLMEEHQVSDELRGTLALGVLRANVEKWEVVRKRTLGDYGSLALEPSFPASEATGSETAEAAFGPLLSEVLPRFLAVMTEKYGWRGQTLAQNTTTYRMFIDCSGDLPVTHYEKRHLTAFYDLLCDLPALYSKDKRWSGLTLSEIVATARDTEHPRLTMKTVKRHFSALGRLFSYLKTRGEYSGENPAHGFEFPDKVRARDKRAVWGGDPLRDLFSSPVWSGCASQHRRTEPGPLIIKDEKYWLPILGLFHGNRLEEFAQLLRSDVRREEGIWFLDINDEGTKQIKNKQSKRRVPLHPRVLKLGFLDYVRDVARNPDDRVFPQLQPGGPDGKLGYFFTKWWTRYRRDVGVYKKGLDYHAFRASAATKLATVGVSLEMRNELLGHEGTSIDERFYQKGFPLSVLAEAIARLEWPEFIVGGAYATGECRQE